MLRRQLGDDIFWKGIRLYYEEYKNKNALTSDFQSVMEKTSNKDLAGFFKQWLFVPGQPELKITTMPGNEKGFTDLIIEQTQDYLFNFDIELLIKDSDRSYKLKIPVSDRITRRTIKTEKILEIFPDPDINLLFTLVKS
jgi:aminopeptidase N